VSDPARPALPPLPAVALEVVGEKDPTEPSRWLRLRRPVLVSRGPSGTSEPFTYDLAERDLLDAVVVAPHFRAADGRRHVYLRSALRPPVALRPPAVWPVPEAPTLGGLWEVIAGLVEADERSAEGLRACAARELWEELGARVDAARLEPLGPSTFPCPGVIGERHFYFHAEVDPAALVPPPEDGSVLERAAAIVALPLEDALSLARAGAIEDAKTELALRRLAELP
jgi:ADP-ribose pyrophosphatase